MLLGSHQLNKRLWTCSVRWRRKEGSFFLISANSVWESSGNLTRKTLNRSSSRCCSKVMSWFIYNLTEHLPLSLSGSMWHRAPSSQIQSQEVQGTGEILWLIRIPADDESPSRTSSRHWHPGHVWNGWQEQGRENILGGVSGKGDKKTTTFLFLVIGLQKKNNL